MTLKLGAKGPEVTALQLDINRIAALIPGPIVAGIDVDGDFGHNTDVAVRAVQHLLSLTQDGVAGPRTLEAIAAFIASNGGSKPILVPKPPVIVTPTGDAPWMDWFLARQGWTEFDHDKELSKGWKNVGLSYDTVIGTEHAWCAMSLNSALLAAGYKGNGRADAVSFEKFGKPCGWIYGAIIPIRHESGAHHVTTFHHWVDQRNMLAALLGGNQSNGIRITTFNLSGNRAGHDECASGPRWPVLKVA